VICVETRHMQAVLKAQINKTDRNDARGIAQRNAPGVASRRNDAEHAMHFGCRVATSWRHLATACACGGGRN
jgi:hypothetical protein